MKKILASLTALLLFATGVFLFPANSFAANAISVKIAGSKPLGEPQTNGMEAFKKKLEELSGGKYEVTVFPNCQMGKEQSYLALTRKGIIQMCCVGPQSSAYHSAMAMMETPMLYESLDHAKRAMKGGTLELITGPYTDSKGNYTKSFVESSGMRVLNAFPLGFRHFFTKKPIHSMKDLDGLRLRVPNVPLYVNFAKLCGIAGQPIPYVELPAALDQGVIDGGDSPFADIISSKIYEVTPYITMSGHILVLQNTLINEEFYQKLPEQDKKWFHDAAEYASDVVWDDCARIDRDAVATIEKAGGHVATPDKSFHNDMMKAGEKAWDLFKSPTINGTPNPAYVPNAQIILDSARSFR